MKRPFLSILICLYAAGASAHPGYAEYTPETENHTAAKDTLRQNQPKDSVLIRHRKDSVTTLADVEITGFVPQVKTDGQLSVVKVRGTLLSRLGTAAALLANTPGLHRGGSGIEVNGLGTPVFILDGREIDQNKVLDLIQANTVKEIRINRAPDLSYSTDGRPTVEIILFRPLDDFLSLSIGDDMAMTRRYSNAGTLGFGIGIKKVSSTLDYMGGIGQFENRETYFRNVYHTQSLSSFDQHRTDLHKLLPQRIRWALDYNIDKRSRFGVEYYFQHTGKETHASGTDVYIHDERHDEEAFLRDGKGISNLHNLSLQYNYKNGRKTFQIVQDFGLSASHNNLNTTEGSGLASIRSRSGNDYRISVTNVKFGTQLPWRVNMSAGLKYTYIANRSSSSLAQVYGTNMVYRLHSEITEHDPQAFVSLSRKTGNVTVSAGVRYRYMHRRSASESDGMNEPDVRSRGVSSFFPLVSLNYKNQSSGTSFFIRYNRTVEHPGFSSLNSGYTYLDSLTYSVGNPDLRSAFSDNISAGLTWRDFSFSARYTHVSDPIVYISEPMYADSDIVVEKDINLSYSNSLRLGLSYSKTISRLNLYAEADVVVPYAKYLFCGEERKADKVAFDANLNLNYMINSFLGAFISFNYQGRRTDMTVSQKAVNNLSAGLMASLLKNRLTVNLGVTDILNGAHYNNLTYRFDNVANGTYGTNDSRGVTLRLSYTIFTKKIKTRTARENEEETGRFL